MHEARETRVPEWVLRIAREHPYMGKYAYPPRSGGACRASLLASTKNFFPVPAPAPQKMEEAINTAVERAVEVPAPSWLTPGGVPSYEDVRDQIIQMNEDANAGYPYSVEGEKKTAWALANLHEFLELVQMRITLLRVTPTPVLKEMTAVELVTGGYSDAVAVIEKNEPTDVEKLAQGRARNVICGSVVDECIDRLLHSKLDKAQIAHWGFVPSCIGIGFDRTSVERTYVAMDILEQTCAPDPLRSSDVRGWEFTFRDWLFWMEAERRCRAYGLRPGSPEAQLIHNRMFVISRSVYVFTDGVVWAQTIDGIGKSGLFITSGTNTGGRQMCAYLIGSAGVVNAGDDAVEGYVDDAEAKYREIGVDLKEYLPASAKHFSFCSHQYDDDGPPVPQKAPKSFFKLCCERPTPDKLRQVVDQFYLADEIASFLDSFARHAPPMDFGLTDPCESPL